MRSLFTRSLLAAAGVLFTAAPVAFSAEKAPAAPAKSASAGTLSRVTEKEAAWAKQARASYPLEVCVTSDEKLGSMGDSPQYVYRVAGQPDRLVVFCCEGCEEDFMKDPAKYLAKIDQAAKAKPSGTAKGDKSGAAHGHK